MGRAERLALAARRPDDARVCGSGGLCTRERRRSATRAHGMRSTNNRLLDAPKLRGQRSSSSSIARHDKRRTRRRHSARIRTRRRRRHERCARCMARLGWTLRHKRRSDLWRADAPAGSSSSRSGGLKRRRRRVARRGRALACRRGRALRGHARPLRCTQARAACKRHAHIKMLFATLVAFRHGESGRAVAHLRAKQQRLFVQPVARTRDSIKQTQGSCACGWAHANTCRACAPLELSAATEGRVLALRKNAASSATEDELASARLVRTSRERTSAAYAPAERPWMNDSDSRSPVLHESGRARSAARAQRHPGTRGEVLKPKRDASEQRAPPRLRVPLVVKQQR